MDGHQFRKSYYCTGGSSYRTDVIPAVVSTQGFYAHPYHAIPFVKLSLVKYSKIPNKRLNTFHTIFFHYYYYFLSVKIFVSNSKTLITFAFNRSKEINVIFTMFVLFELWTFTNVIGIFFCTLFVSRLKPSAL